MVPVPRARLPARISSGCSRIPTSVVDPDPKDPKLFAGSGSGSVTRGYGSGFGSETGLETYLKSSKKFSNLLIMTLKIH
jgi:hypothetical protein